MHLSTRLHVHKIFECSPKRAHEYNLAANQPAAVSNWKTLKQNLTCPPAHLLLRGLTQTVFLSVYLCSEDAEVPTQPSQHLGVGGFCTHQGLRCIPTTNKEFKHTSALLLLIQRGREPGQKIDLWQRSLFLLIYFCLWLLLASNFLTFPPFSHPSPSPLPAPLSVWASHLSQWHLMWSGAHPRA